MGALIGGLVSAAPDEGDEDEGDQHHGCALGRGGGFGNRVAGRHRRESHQPRTNLAIGVTSSQGERRGVDTRTKVVDQLFRNVEDTYLHNATLLIAEDAFSLLHSPRLAGFLRGARAGLIHFENFDD